MDKKIVGFDFIRSFAVFFVFIAHILNKQSHNEGILLFIRSFSPGLTMSVLGFISAYLLSSKYDSFNGIFYVKRFSRIYASLIVCLSTITILHILLSYDVINQHSIIHFMGLSFFLELFQVSNKSSLGGGLWFVTIINFMYLLLPLLTHLYKHKNSKLHLLLIILLCLFLDTVMYGTASGWNVAIAFNIGCYIGLNSDMDKFSKKHISYYLLTTFLILFLCAIATSNNGWQVRSYLLPLYPFFAVPLLFKIGNKLKGPLKSIIMWFSSISYEVYILHFYFINDKFSDLFPGIRSVWLQVLTAIIIVIPLALVLSKIAILIGNVTNRYLLQQNRF